MSDGFCLEGNCGFPVVVNGLSSVTIPQQSSDISLQFNKNSSISFDNRTQTIEVSDPSSQSFFIGGNQYLLNMIRLCQATPNGLEYNQSKLPALELQLWGSPPANALNNGRIAVLIIPIYENTYSMNIYATNFMDLLQGNNKDISTLFPHNISVIRYETCIEYGDSSYKNKKIVVAYWQSGMNFAFSVRKEDFLASGIPLSLTDGMATYSAFTQTGPNGTKTFDVKDKVINAVSSLPYTTNVTASTTDFSKRFAQMYYTTTTETRRKQPQQLKCKAIDRSKDIKDGLLIIDPSTGELLTDIEADQAAKDAQYLAVPSSTITGGDIQRTMAIVLGTIGGTILLALAIMFIMHFTAGQTEAGKAAAAAAAAAAATKPAIQWVDLLLPTFLGLCLFGIITVVTVSMIMTYS